MIQLLGVSAISIYVYFRLEDVKIQNEAKFQHFIGDFRELFKVGNNLKRFVFIRAIDSMSWSISMPFGYLYAVEIKGANSITVGYMGTCVVLISMVIAIPLGSLADNRGRKFVIFLARPFFWASYLLLILASKGVSWILLFAWCLRGVEIGHMANTTMSMEMVPSEFRGRWTGLIGLLQNSVRIPAMLLGGYIYENFNPYFVFIITILFDALIRTPILATIPDTHARAANK